jgi:hypothetical protein
MTVVMAVPTVAVVLCLCRRRNRSKQNNRSK